MSLSTKFLVRPGETIDLDRLDAGWKPKGMDRDEAEEEFAQLTSRLRELQHMMYAEDKRSLLVVLQGRDAAGKDGTIRHVFGPMNPQGCKVTSFKVPSKLEASHDFLWRCHLAAPRRGQVGIFNRSHYEDVLVVRVHDLVPEERWKTRYEHINNFERLLADSRTTVLKFMLHIDREEQLERFRKRIDKPHKNWKISEEDYSERRYWHDYTEAFNEVLRRCSTDEAPWFVIPSNRKWARNFAIASIVAEAMEGLGMAFPEPEVDMEEIKKMYHEASNAE
jgi:PPK2 family polyphosphate:nucleotide phosphotransferase